MYPSASSRAATTAMFQAMANGGRALHFYAMEAFGVRNAALRLATALRTRAAIGTAAALELDVDCLAAPVAHHTAAPQILPPVPASELDRKSTRLNSSHSQISYAVFCLKQKHTRPPVSRCLITCHLAAVLEIGPGSGMARHSHTGLW